MSKRQRPPPLIDSKTMRDIADHFERQERYRRDAAHLEDALAKVPASVRKPVRTIMGAVLGNPLVLANVAHDFLKDAEQSEPKKAPRRKRSKRSKRTKRKGPTP